MAFETLALRQRVLVNVNKLDTSTTFLGQKLSIPLFISPVGGYTGLAHPQGVLPVIRGAEAAGTTAVVASGVRPGFEAAAKAAQHPLITQLYITSDRKWLSDRLDRVRAAVYRALPRRYRGPQLLRAGRSRYLMTGLSSAAALLRHPAHQVEPRLGPESPGSGLREAPILLKGNRDGGRRGARSGSNRAAAVWIQPWRPAARPCEARWTLPEVVKAVGRQGRSWCWTAACCAAPTW